MSSSLTSTHGRNLYLKILNSLDLNSSSDRENSLLLKPLFFCGCVSLSGLSPPDSLMLCLLKVSPVHHNLLPPTDHVLPQTYLTPALNTLTPTT